MKKKFESEILFILNSEGKPMLIEREQVLIQHKVMRKSKGSRGNACLCMCVRIYVSMYKHT